MLPGNPWLRLETIMCYKLQCFYWAYKVSSVRETQWSDDRKQKGSNILPPITTQCVTALDCTGLEHLNLKIAFGVPDWSSMFKKSL